MKKHICIVALLLMAAMSFAQTQQGFVKTKGRMDAKGNLIPGQGLKGATVSVQGRTAVLVNADDGSFTFPVPETQFRIDSVKKKGYQLVDLGSCPRSYERSSNPIYFVMESPEQQLQDQLNAERKIRRNLQKQLQAREDEIEELKANQKISDDEYRASLQKLYADQESNEQLISDMAKRYAELDYDQLDDFYRQVSYCIENGQLVKADSLLRTKGDVTLQVEEQLRKGQAIREREEQLNQAKSVHIADMEELAKRCYSYYETFAAQHLNDTAAYYLELRASLDTTNVEWQNDAALFIGVYLADYTKALVYHQRGLRWAIAKYGEQSNYVADEYDNIGSNYFSMDDYDTAMECHYKALAIKKTLFSEDHPEMVNTYSEIGTTYFTIGDYENALEFHNKALDICKKTFGEESSLVVESYNNIGTTYFGMGEYENALKFFRDKALPIYIKVYGTEHPYLALLYNNIGISYHYLQDYEKSLESNYKALSIRKRLFGEGHPDVAWSYDNLGFTYCALGDYEKALEYHNKSLKIYTETIGEEHSSVAGVYDNIGWVYDRQNDYEKALEYYQKAYRLLVSSMGEDHPYTIYVKERLVKAETNLKK
jgi:tetratricopeptide (TPR) repeat protein